MVNSLADYTLSEIIGKMGILNRRRALFLSFVGIITMVDASDGSNTASAQPERFWPVSVAAWEVSGSLLRGRHFRVRLLEMEQDRGRFRQFWIWSDVPEVSATDRKWFVPESAMESEPVDFAFRSKVYFRSELENLWQTATAGLAACPLEDAQSEQSSPTFRHVSTTEEKRLGLVGSCSRRQASAASRSEGSGGLFSKDAPLGGLKPFMDNLAVNLDEKRNLAAAFGAKDVFTSIAEFDPFFSGMEIPFRALFNLSDDGEWLAVEEAISAIALTSPWDQEQRIGLRVLGDLAQPDAAYELLTSVKRSVREERPDMMGLSLRALLKADPKLARLKATEFLKAGIGILPAFGVFALTEPTLTKELESVDVTDSTETRRAIQKILVHLRSSASDGELRAAAADVLLSMEQP